LTTVGTIPPSNVNFGIEGGTGGGWLRIVEASDADGARLGAVGLFGLA
jgi:hypothetical protein